MWRCPFFFFYFWSKPLCITKWNIIHVFSIYMLGRRECMSLISKVLRVFWKPIRIILKYDHKFKKPRVWFLNWKAWFQFMVIMSMTCLIIFLFILPHQIQMAKIKDALYAPNKHGYVMQCLINKIQDFKWFYLWLA